MHSRTWRLGLVCAALAGGPGAVWAAGRDWTGSARCGSCHPAELAAWRATAHARPFAAGRGRATICLGCHTTGESPAGPVVENVVGCEACHGAGADYAADDLMRNRRLAFELGLVDLGAPAIRTQVCAACHGPVASRPGLDPSRLAAPAHPSLPGGLPAPSAERKLPAVNPAARDLARNASDASSSPLSPAEASR